MSKKILIVDDEMGARVLIKAFLDRGGFEVVTAKNGRDALALIETGTLPDLILLDVNMPEMDGITFTRTVRGKFPDALLPIIVLSASGDADTVTRAMRAGATDFLNKPILHHDLSAKVKAILKLEE